MKKKITALLAILLLVSLVGCGNNIDNTEPTPSDATPTETTTETTVEPSTEPTTEPTATPSAEPTTAPTQEPTTAPTAEQEETVPPSEEPTPEPSQEPTTPPATPAPVNTPAPTPTPTPAPVHTHNYAVTQSPTCTTEGIKTCSCGDTISISANGHTYTTQTIQGTGHVEQVQVGTKWVEDYTTVIEYECGNCHWKSTDREAFYTHIGTLGSLKNASCPTGNYYTTEKRVANGGHEEPVYENQWVVDTPDTTIRICSVCGVQE